MRRILLVAFGWLTAFGLAAYALAPAAGLPASPLQRPGSTPGAGASAFLSATEALRTGAYARAIEAARGELVAVPRSHTSLRTLATALSETGHVVEAEHEVRRFLERNARVGDAWNLLGDLLVELGRPAEAETAFIKALDLRALDSLSAEASLGILLFDRGLRTEANVRFEKLITAYNEGRVRTARDLIAVGRACRYLGAFNPDSFKDALKAFDEAAPLDETHEARIHAGVLFLEKFNSTDARDAFEAVLAVNKSHPRALVGLAAAKDFDGERGVPELLAAALEVNPNLADAHAARSRLLLALEDFDGALEAARKALVANPVSVEALSARASTEYVRGDENAFAATRRIADAAYPKSAELLVAVSEAAARNRLYREASQLAADALKLDPDSSKALASLGQNQLRLGEIEAARLSLERSFKIDPYNVWVKNTLDLMDTFSNYTTTSAGRFTLMIEKGEAGVLAAPMTALANEAMDKLTAKYQYEPKGPVRIEAYPSHADFSVRTVGLAGLGALGVCFGPVVAIDSPQARDRGTFNWGSTLWHELAHVVTLGASGNRVPRWLTEGISVYEERRARPGWGDDLSLEFLLAYRDGLILPLEELNNGFVRPKTREQVGLSYYQASLVVEHIERKYGVDALRKLLLAYKTGATNERAFESVLSRTMKQVDADFQGDLRARLEKPLPGFPRVERAAAADIIARPDGRTALETRVANNDRDFLAHLELGLLNHREKREDEALKHLERAAQIWPESAGEESPYFPIARIKRARGDDEGAIAALQSLVARNENHDAARAELSTLLEKRGRGEEALEVLESRVFIYPFDPKLHERRAELASALKRSAELREARLAIVALDPVDKAEAFYQLAVADLEVGDRPAARRNVLRALEVAPRFERAQEFLLKLRREEKMPR